MSTPHRDSLAPAPTSRILTLRDVSLRCFFP